MPAPSHISPTASGSAVTTTTATFDEAASTLTSTHGMLATVRRYSSTAADPTPPTPSGWQFVAGGVNGNAAPTSRLFEGVYRRLGDGQTRSITITGASAVAVVNLYAWANVADGADFTEDATTVDVAPAGTSLNLGPLDATADGDTLFAHVALGGTFGTPTSGDIPAWTGITRRNGSATSTGAYAYSDVTDADAAAPTVSVSWANSTMARATALVVKTGVRTNPATQTYPRLYHHTAARPKRPARIRGVWRNGAEDVISSWRVRSGEVVSSARVPYLDPYDPLFWGNVAIGSGAIFEAATDPITAAWLKTVPAVNKEAWSIAPFTSTTADPIVELREVSHSGVLSKTITGVYAKASAAATAGTDKHVLLVQPDGHTCYEIFYFSRPSPGVIQGTGVKKQSLRGKGNETGTRAFGFSSFIGLIRHHEVAAGKITHIMAMAAPNAFLSKSGPVWPAKWMDNDAQTAYFGPGPIGTVFGIPPSVNVLNLGLTAEGVTLARGFQDYGGVITDRAATGALYMEPGGTAADVARYDRLRADWPKIHPLLRRITNNNPGTMTTPYVPDSVAGVMGGGTRRQPFKAAFPPL